MSYQDKLVAQINQELDRLQAERQTWVPEWITHTICEAHNGGLADNDEADFWRHGGYGMCRLQVTKIINKRAGDNAERDVSKQISLPGFDREHLQDYYVVKRNGDDVAICIIDMTDDEIDTKAEMHLRLKEAHAAHADELIRFKHWRSVSAHTEATNIPAEAVL